jgi:hypothetical protein
MLSIFSGQALAGNTDAWCKNLKDKDYAPALYGLCVAWHNADEHAKDRISENYRRKSGGDDVPGSVNLKLKQDFYCPCWTDVRFSQVCSLGSPFSRFIYGFVNVVTWEDAEIGLDEWFSADARGCIYDGQFTDGVQMSDSLSEDEVLDCLAEIEAIAFMYDKDDCDVN